MRGNKLLYAILFCGVACGAALAVELTGTVSVNVTSDTAAAAKQKAFNSAGRDVIARELRNYAVAEQLEDAIKNSSNEELLNIISSSSVDSERVSDTTYSANISFVIDGDAARSWMEKYSVQNWLPASAPVVVAPENSVMIYATLLQPMADWVSLNAVSRAVSVDIATTNMVGNNVSFGVLDKDAAKFISALRMDGWNVSRVDNGYKIWK